MHPVRTDQHLIVLLRLVIVVVLAVGIVAASRQWARRSGQRSEGVPDGLTLVTSGSCSECVRAVDALDGVGATYAIVDARDCEAIGIRTMTVPVAVVGRSGEAVMVRRGSAVAADAKRLMSVAHGVRSV